jgi:hypothetical protein
MNHAHSSTAIGLLQQPVRFLVLWLSGYYAGKRKNPIVDVEKIEGNADRVSAYCDTNRKTVLMRAIEIVLGPGK